ncbi:hypothetical protein bAD24_I01025 [Burkholderia sp. AD24]|nr:hypothetical protein bAD24_I01025 [Burkholderia sp. AD24]
MTIGFLREALKSQEQTQFSFQKSGCKIIMSQEFTFAINSIRFDEDYHPSENTRITTNFANLARGKSRGENLRNTFRMIDDRFNALAHWDNPEGNRYAVKLEIISVAMNIEGEGGGNALPLIEILKTNIVDRKTGKRIEGIAGNNFSSYVRDYDFSVVLREHNKQQPGFSTPDNFGDLHGNLFKCFVNSSAYRDNFTKPPVICLSVSSSKTYHRTVNQHPVLGVEYQQNEYSLTDEYFAKMGLKVRYFMPPNSVAPLAFYFTGDLLADYTNLELISTISTMDTFQKIYRPEIYNANSPAGKSYQPSLKHHDFSLTRIDYDREERSRLAVEQGRFVEEQFIKPYQTILEQWSADYAL